MNNLWPIASIVVNLLLALLLYSLRSSIRIAILELENRLVDKYATKEDVQRVEAQVKLADRVDNGFAQTFRLLSSRGDSSASVDR